MTPKDTISNLTLEFSLKFSLKFILEDTGI